MKNGHVFLVPHIIACHIISYKHETRGCHECRRVERKASLLPSIGTSIYNGEQDETTEHSTFSINEHRGMYSYCQVTPRPDRSRG